MEAWDGFDGCPGVLGVCGMTQGLPDDPGRGSVAIILKLLSFESDRMVSSQ
jgi:hypothetical protein